MVFTYKQILENSNILSNYKVRDFILLRCEKCDSDFNTTKRDIIVNIKRKIKSKYCSRECFYKTMENYIRCANCNIFFNKCSAQMKITKNHFCSRSCAATYNNKHKTYGTRRSKLEKWIEEQLTSLYPNLEIQYNKKEAIQSELDIYIPSLKLAFELNGIFHYEPIYGQDKLDKTKQNDVNKFMECQKRDISLCIIDTSSQKYVKPSTSQKFLDIIIKIIGRKYEAIP